MAATIDPSLLELIDATWQALATSPEELDEDKIYQLYTGLQFDEPVRVDRAEFDAFIGPVRNLAAQFDPAFRCLVQVDGWPALSDFVDDGSSKWLETAAGTFYHFVSRSGSSGVTHRVYASLRSPVLGGPTVMTHLLGLMQERPDLLATAKLVGPAGLGRRDHVVVYAKSRFGQDLAVGHLIDHCSDLLGTRSPMATFAVYPGIGIADEPARVRDDQDRLIRSHGSLMAAIIWSIAEPYADQFEPAELGDLTAFRSEVEAEFWRWNVAPSRPFRTDRAQRAGTPTTGSRRGSRDRAPARQRRNAQEPAVAAATDWT